MTRQHCRNILAVLAALALPACTEAPTPAAPPVTVAAKPATTQTNFVRVPMKSSGGVPHVAVAIVGVCCFPFVVDSGAADVSVSPAIFRALMSGGYITNDDLIDVISYKNAGGTSTVGLRFRIPSLTVGGITVRNVVGSVSKESNMLLLGQSFLKKFRFYAIDNRTGELVLGG